MRGQCTLDGIVLRTYDVGEADRLCIVLTRERGRIAARARAVRKLGSRMGALLLPGRRVTIDLREENEYGTIVAAKLNGEIAALANPMAFAAAQQGIELLLLLTEDDEPLPQAFDLCFQFLHACAAEPARSLLPFQLRLFHVLGLLPAVGDDRRFTLLNDVERSFVRLCTTTGDFGDLCEAAEESSAIHRFVEDLREQHARRDLKSAAVYATLAA